MEHGVGVSGIGRPLPPHLSVVQVIPFAVERAQVVHRFDVTGFSCQLPPAQCVACHEHGTGVAGFLPGSWDHLGCQLWDHRACRVGGSLVSSLDRFVSVVDVEVRGRGIQGGQCG